MFGVGMDQGQNCTQNHYTQFHAHVFWLDLTGSTGMGQYTGLTGTCKHKQRCSPVCQRHIFAIFLEMVILDIVKGTECQEGTCVSRILAYLTITS